MYAHVRKKRVTADSLAMPVTLPLLTLLSTSHCDTSGHLNRNICSSPEAVMNEFIFAAVGIHSRARKRRLCIGAAAGLKKTTKKQNKTKKTKQADNKPQLLKGGVDTCCQRCRTEVSHRHVGFRCTSCTVTHFRTL